LVVPISLINNIINTFLVKSNGNAVLSCFSIGMTGIGGIKGIGGCRLGWGERDLRDERDRDYRDTRDKRERRCAIVR